MNEEQIFLAALDQPDAAARNAYLEEACQGNPELRVSVEKLLPAHYKSGEFLDVPAPHQVEIETSTGEAVTVLSMGLSAPQEAPAMNDHYDASDLEFLAPTTRPDSLGRIDHYEVLQVLGKGGFGIVLRAFDDVLQRVVAIKVMTPQLAATSPARKRFTREARTSAQVRHENVVQVYEVGEQPLPYLVMEFIPGETLQQRLDRLGPLDVPETVRIGRQIAEGLAAAHAMDLIHRDIKPGNVLLEGSQLKVKITDFGVARAADDASMTQSGMIAGTPMYMAPEQALGHTLDQRMDLFSLGTVMYQMVAGRPPFRAATSMAVLKRVVEDTPRNIREVVPETPQWLCDIIAKLHAKKPDDRFQSAREVADVLADCEDQLKQNSRLRDFSRIPRSGVQSPAQTWKWASAAALLLPMIALAASELAGVTHVLRRQQAAPVAADPGGNPARVSATNQQTPVSTLKPPPVAHGKNDTPVAAARQEPLPAIFKNGIGMEFVIIPNGRSWLGGGKDKPGDQEVEIPADFYLGKYEVTQEEWEQVMGTSPSWFSRTGNGMDAVKDISDTDLKRFPVEQVSWNQCQLFVAKLNRLEKQTGWVYRLPKEAEWEYACRGGPMANQADSAFDFYFAKPTNTLLPEQANIGKDKGLNRTCKVGSYEPNRLGLFDMHGNAWEWCDDTEETADGASRRVIRGGSWESPSGNHHAAKHNAYGGGNYGVGLRLARVPSGDPSPEVKTPPLAIAPFNDADVQRIAALPAAEQVEEVRKELMRRNPGLDGTAKHKIEGGSVTELTFTPVNGQDAVTDLSPVRALAGLTSLNLWGCSGLVDLEPIKGMPLIRLVVGSFHVNNQVRDLEPLRGMQLTELQLYHCQVRDMEPLKGMPLTRLTLLSRQVRDFEPLKGMPLTTLYLDTGTQIKDFTPLAGMPLTGLALGQCQFRDVELLKGMALTLLSLPDTQVQDLEPLRGMPLKTLRIYKTGVTDLKPLQGMELEEIRLTPKNITQGLDILRDMKSLKTIGIDSNQAWPAAEFWERLGKGEFGALFTDAAVQRIAALPAAEQVEEVRKELMRRNPGYGGDVKHKIDGDVVTEFQIVTDQVTDIAPVRVFGSLRVLDLNGTHTKYKGNGQLADLSPLAEMNLAGLTRLNLSFTRVGDAGLVHFQDCTNLTYLNLDSTQVSDAGLAYFKNCRSLDQLLLGRLKVSGAGLAHFKDCKKLTLLDLSELPLGDAEVGYFKECEHLTRLELGRTLVTDTGLAQFQNCKKLQYVNLLGTKVGNVGLAYLKDCQELTGLFIASTQVTDLSLIQDLPLKALDFDFKFERDAEILRSLKTLERINQMTAAEFWERLGKGEFQ